jgi:hypothetical protein
VECVSFDKKTTVSLTCGHLCKPGRHEVTSKSQCASASHGVLQALKEASTSSQGAPLHGLSPVPHAHPWSPALRLPRSFHALSVLGPAPVTEVPRWIPRLCHREKPWPNKQAPLRSGSRLTRSACLFPRSVCKKHSERGFERLRSAETAASSSQVVETPAAQPVIHR